MLNKIKSTVGWWMILFGTSLVSNHIGAYQSLHNFPTAQVVAFSSSTIDPCKGTITQEPLNTITTPPENAEVPEIKTAEVTAEESRQYAELKAVKKYYLLLRHPDGRYELRTGGSPAWRYNNPGKLAYGNFTETNGAIGNDGPLAIFSNYEDGKKAFEVFLFQSELSNFKEMTIEQAINKLANPKFGYKPKEYLAYVLKETDQKSTKYLKDMTVDERDDLIDAIQSYENWIAGNIVIYKDKDEFVKKGY
jgi:hypothetical protein